MTKNLEHLYMNNTIQYKPIEERTFDTQYTDLLKHIMENGTDKKPIHASLEENANSGHSFAREVTNASLSFDLTNGFPIIGHRDMSKVSIGAIAEISAFLNGARTLDDLRKFNVPDLFWKKWVTKEKCAIFGLEEGDLGPGSYGPTLRALETPDGRKFDQLAALHENVELWPMSRALMITTWNPIMALGSKYQGFDRKVVVAPCHGTDFNITLFPETMEMEVTSVQRSADVSVGLQFNMIQWCTLGFIFAMIHGYKYTRYTHHILNAHIYDVQFDAVKELTSRDPVKFPTVTLEPLLDYVKPWDLRKSHFVIGDDYKPHPFFTIPTPI